LLLSSCIRPIPGGSWIFFSDTVDILKRYFVTDEFVKWHKTYLVQLLLANLDQPAPNVAHLLLKFDVNQLVERTMLQPKRHFRQETGFSYIQLNFFLCV